jgi:type VI protein secretion system component VasK
MNLDVNGQFTVYGMGAPQWMPIQWPGPSPETGAALRGDPAYGVTVESRVFPGPWGFFRLLDTAADWGGSPGAPKVTWQLSAGTSKVNVEYDIQPTGSTHPFQRGYFLRPIPPP